MKSSLKQIISITALSICSIALNGCSTSNSTIIDKKKFYIYECKSYKIVQNLSDSTSVFLYIKPYDKATLNLFESGILSVKILNEAMNNDYKWYEFDAIQSEVTKTYSDTCKDYIEDDNTVFIEDSASKVDVDGSTYYNFEYFLGGHSALFCFELKQIKKGHFSIRHKGYVF